MMRQFGWTLNIENAVPAGYDAYLTNRYGDYMTPQNVSNTHGGVIFDTEMDYKEYLSKLKCNEN